MRLEGRPQSVQQNILKGNEEGHSRQSSAGGRATARINRLRKIERHEHQAETLAEAALHQAVLENDAAAIAHHEETLREIRGE